MKIAPLLKDIKLILRAKTYGVVGRALCTAAYFGHSLTKNEKKLLALKNKFKGRRAFIIGNGPSLTKTDIRLLKDEITIGCNGIFLLFKDMGFLPTFYTVEDTLVAEDRAEIINRIRGTLKVFPYDLRYCLKPDGDTVFVNFVRKYRGFPKFSSDFSRNVFWGGTVTFLNLQLAYYLGIREVYLIGIDHSYQVPSSAQRRRGAVILSQSDDTNHFHSDYFGPGFRYHDPLPERMEVSYEKARSFFEKNGGAIYNATAGGRLEVFERRPFACLF